MSSENTRNVVSFTVSADEEVDQDFITITFQAAESGTDPNKIQTELAKKLKLALDVVRPKKVDGEVNVRNGSFQIRPSYDKKGAINGYYGAVQMVVSGTDTKTVAGFTGEISSMTILDTQHSVSPALRKATEEKLSLAAIALWREKGESYAQAFGSSTYLLVNADVRVDSGNHYPRSHGMRVMAASASMGGGAMEEEAGKETLTATVSGNIQLVS